MRHLSLSVYLSSYLGWSQNVQHVTVGRQNLEIYRLQDLIRCVQFQEQHDENPVIRNLLEVRGSHVVIYEENPGNNSQNLVEQVDLNNVSQLSFTSWN